MKKTTSRWAALLTVCILIESILPAPSFALSDPIPTMMPVVETGVVNVLVAETTTGPSLIMSAGSTTGSALSLTTSASSLTGSALSLTGSALSLTFSAIQLASSENMAGSTSLAAIALKTAALEESKWYRKQNPLKKEHQKLLYDSCRKFGLDYVDMLALIHTESNFQEKCVSRIYYGYFQISKGNCANWAATLKTPNTPLDGAINIRWGTTLFAGILADKRVKGLTGTKKRDAALSVFQRGTGGYDRYGLNKVFLAKFYKKRAIVSQWYGVK